MPKPVELFFSYAHKDQELVHRVRGQLLVYERQHLLATWHDRLVPSGTEWRGLIDERLAQADIILLFLSPDFFASDYCNDVETADAMRRHESGLARVIPVILRPCDWRASRLGEIEALPAKGKPITKWSDRDAACLDVAKGVLAVAGENQVNGRGRSAGDVVEGGRHLDHHEWATVSHA